MEHLLANLSTKVRRETRNGREYLVAPVSMIVPGVLNGSKGALYYPKDEIARDPSVWNGIPMVVYHPTENGNHVSARSPKVLDKSHVGDVFNARINKRGALVGEGWFDVEATKRVDNRVLKALQAGKKIELSTGLFTDNDRAPQGSTYRDKPYEYVARNYRADHLAILPDQTGACSVQDGCGVNVNHRRKVRNVFCPTGEGGGQDPSCGNDGAGASGGKHSVKLPKNPKKVNISTAAEALEQMGYKLGKADTDLATKKTSYLVEGHGKKQWMDTDAIKKLVYDGANNEQNGRGGRETNNSKGGLGMAKLNPKKREAIVNELIANECCWEEEDRKVLNELSGERLRALQGQAAEQEEMQATVNSLRKEFGVPDAITVNAMPAFIKKKIEEKAAKDDEEDDEEEEEVKNKKPTKNAKPVECEPTGNKQLTDEEWLKQAPATIREDIQFARNAKQRQKTDIIGRLTANVAKDKREQVLNRLNKMSLDELQDMLLIAPAPAVNEDRSPLYDGAAAPATNRRDDFDEEDVLPLPSMDWKEMAKSHKAG